MARSLRLKLIMFMVMLLIAAMFVVGAFLVNGVKKFYQNNFFEQMKDVFTPEYIAELNSESERGPEHLTEMLMKTSGLGVDITTRNVYVLSRRGQLLQGSDEKERVEITKNILTAMEGEVGMDHSLVKARMDVAIPVGTDGNRYVVYVLDSGEEETKLSGEVMVIILQALALGVCISVALSVMFLDILIAPIERLRDGAERIASGDFSQKLDVNSKDEIGVLTVTFNNMANVLEKTLDEIENEKNKLSTLFLHMTDGVLAFSRDGALIHKNPAAEQLLGLRDTGEMRYDDMFRQDAPLETVLQLRRPEFIEAEKKAGKKDLELFFAPFSEQGEQGGVLVVVHDVTEQRKAEELRREFVANVSHELRTPLTNVKSYAETLIDSPDLSEEMREKFLSVILGEADRMSHIVQDLLTLSRFDYGRSEIQMEPFSFTEAVRNVYEAVGMEARRRQQQIELEIRGDIPHIKGDRSRVEQVVMNVVSNALKYTQEGGHISLRIWREQSKVCLSVTDDGIGIPEKDIPRLFERFYRVDKARSRESGGTGLGLSIALEIMQQHEGTINVSSRLGEGTCVTLCFPVTGDRA